jgi:phosphoglycerate dehydrogenase-like enzyme
MSRAHVIDFDAMTGLVLTGCFKAVIDVFPEEPFDLDYPTTEEVRR